MRRPFNLGFECLSCGASGEQVNHLDQTRVRSIATSRECQFRLCAEHSALLWAAAGFVALFRSQLQGDWLHDCCNEIDKQLKSKENNRR